MVASSIAADVDQHARPQRGAASKASRLSRERPLVARRRRRSSRTPSAPSARARRFELVDSQRCHARIIACTPRHTSARNATDGSQSRGARGRQVTGEQRGGAEAQRDGQIRHPVERIHPEEHRGHQPRQRRGARETHRDADPGEEQAVPQEQAAHVTRRGAERHPDPDLARPLRRDVGNDAVDADDAEQERHPGRDASITSANDVCAIDVGANLVRASARSRPAGCR